MLIRAIQSFEEYEACVELQRIVWEFADRDLMPARYMKVTHLHGGSVLGAFDGGQLIGYAYSQPSIHEGQIALHSNILAVHPDYQNRGIGWLLKLEQRREALSRGIRLMTWTYDPLQARNAYLNLNKLGAFVRTYYRDLFGSSSSSTLHSGLGTDRVEVEWWLESSPVRRILGELPTEDESGSPAVLPPGILFLRENGTGNPRLEMFPEKREEVQLSLEIPANLNRLMDKDYELARDWRAVSRSLLMHYFESGYRIVRLARVPQPSGAPDAWKTYYILEAAGEN